MAIQISNEQLLRKYLLGLLPEAEAARVEEQWLTDDGSYEELLAAESEVIDDYLSNTLTEEEQKGFLNTFLATDERREKLRFAKAFRHVVNRQPAAVSQPDPSPTKWYEWLLPGNPRFAYALGAVVLVAVLGISFIAYRNSRSTGTEQQLVYAVTLRPGLTRGGEDMQRITVPAGNNVVRFQADVGTQYRSYQAELVSEGKTVIVLERLTSQNKDGKNLVDIDIPADKLPVGDYRLRLSGVSDSGSLEPVSTYAFRIAR